MHKLLLGFTVISDFHWSFLPNKATLPKYCLTQWISQLPGSFEIHWVRQYFHVNFSGLVGIVNASVYKTRQANFNRSRAWQIVLILTLKFYSSQAWLFSVSANTADSWEPILVVPTVQHGKDGRQSCTLCTHHRTPARCQLYSMEPTCNLQWGPKFAKPETYKIAAALQIFIFSGSCGPVKICQPSQIANSWDQRGAHLGPVGRRWAPCWPHKPCYQGWLSPRPSGSWSSA